MRTIVLISVGAIVAVLVVLGCPTKEASPPIQQPVSQAPQLSGLPVEMSVRQRTTTIVPGSDGAVSLTIDDITRGQVMVSLAGPDGDVVLAPASLRPGESAAFKLGEVSYFVVLDELENELVSDDSATLIFTDSPPTAGPAVDAAALREPSSSELEKEKIQRLIDHVGSLEGAVFIRNGQEHTAADAAAHLQRKWDVVAGELATAEEFIDRLASKSSVSGEPYRIRLDDGTETTAGEYLHQRLAIIERGR
jgi:hypothetical protein